MLCVFVMSVTGAISLACCSRATKNASFFAEVEHAFTSLADSRVKVGGNAPVMVQRFLAEGVEQVMLGANMSPELRSQLDTRVRGDRRRVYYWLYSLM